ncbi:hypothetical protein NW762_013904 [Fusarium torreyae]|uniref:FAD-binding domain-containing protein n=1 Tax=Fusarium torreyae TaxID=1237075 RepID=A0A9W8V735_9HYPO|nr:hypothetical protein NW762_013904 [Fusarium torreyae]
MAPFKVIIVGGGLSGALLANGLLNNNVDVTVYERDVQHSKREGYQIRLGDAAIKALTLCCTEEHSTAILRKLGQSTGVTLTAPTLCNTKLEPVLDLSTLPAYSKSSAINRVVLRDLLLEPVNAKSSIKFGKAFQRYEIISDDAGGDKVVVYFADGTSNTCDILIGADGSGSKVNKLVGAGNIVDIKTHWSFVSKGNVPMERLPELPSRLLKGPIITFSKGISLFYSLYLPASFDGRPQESVDSKIIYDAAQASYYWGLNIPKHLLPYNDISEIKDRRQACLDAIKDWAPD